MLLRYPVLGLIGAPAMALAIAAGAATFEAVNRVTNPDLPLPDGGRIVGFTYWDRLGEHAGPPFLVRLPDLAGQAPLRGRRRRLPAVAAESGEG